MLTTSLKVGDLAPDFTAVDTQGHSHTLSRMLRDGPLVLAFFPKAFTPGCSMEMRSYRERFADVEKLGATVIAISTDDAETLRRFQTQLEAPFAFVADPQAELVKLYDVKTPLLKLATRHTFVIGTDGRIVSITSGRDAVDPTAALAACSAP